MSKTNTHIEAQGTLWSQLSDIVRANMGLHYPKERSIELQRGIAAAAPAFGKESAEACARWLLSAQLTQNQIEILAQYLTVGETYFFRDKPGFEILEEKILPQLVKTKACTNRRLRIWSVGCSSGEEPYSIAISIARVIPKLDDWNITILATDINPCFLNKAMHGIYSDWSFRNTPQGIQEKFFKKTKEGRFKIASSIKAMVKFSYLNLVKDTYPSVENGSNDMDIIFCRNVLMYFEQSIAYTVAKKLSLSLLDVGWLFLSPVDIPNGVLPYLVPVNFSDTIIYRKDKTISSNEYPSLVDSLEELEHPLTNIQPVGKPAMIAEPKLQPLEMKIRISLEDATELYNQGRYDKAARIILEILTHNPNDIEAMALLARIYANKGELDEAQNWCEKALTTDKLNGRWWYLYATILQEQGLDEDALVALKRALYLDQNNALVHFTLGNLMRRLKNDNEAKLYFINALSILSGYQQEQVLPESEGLTAGRLAELIKATLAAEVRS
jgi:chemotaxis protein methyltransferase CheR